MIDTFHIYDWCVNRFEYYEHKVTKTIYELYDDVKIMLSKEDRVKGDKSFFAAFMFFQCKKYEKLVWLVETKNGDLYCADRKYIYDPVLGPQLIDSDCVVKHSFTVWSWKTK